VSGVGGPLGGRRAGSCGLRALVVAWTLGAGACVFPHRMERFGPPGAPCPDVEERRAVDAPPDTSRLRWYRSTDGRSRDHGRAACASVGPPLFVAVPPGAYPRFSVGDSLTIASWGADEGDGDLRGLLEEGLGARCAGSRSGLRNGVPGFVLLAQKVRRGGDPERDVAAVAASCGLAVHYVPSIPWDRGGPRAGDVGDAVLSTLPLTTPLAVELPIEASRAVAVGATVRLPRGERVRFVSAHVDGLSTLTRTLLGGNQVRARQARGLIDGLDRADRDGPFTAATIVGADLALWDDRETALRLMERAFPESPAWDGRPTHGSFSPDHILFRRGVFGSITLGRYTRLEEGYGSSHLGRSAQLGYLPATSPVGGS